MGAPGFDDSPMATIEIGTAKPITFVYPYYENPQFLAHQLEQWASYVPLIHQHLSVIIVDDGSPDNPAEAILKGTSWPFSLRLFRIEVDVRWNWLAARNIGMFYAREGWCMLTDMDHVVNQYVATSLMLGRHMPGTIYRFSRREHTGAQIHPHPNSMFMTRAMFWKVGGYDEALSGHYGTDGDWRRRCAATAPIRLLPEALIRHEYQGDSSTTRYKRKQPEDAKKKAIIARRTKNWRPLAMSFPHHEVVL